MPGCGVPGGAPHAACLPQVGEEAHFPVKSTCPCNFTLHYEVTARGNIVLSGRQPARLTQQRSRRAAPETHIRLMHLSETGEPGHRQEFLVSSEPLRLGRVTPERRGKQGSAQRGACLGAEGTCSGQDGAGARRRAVTSCWRWRGPLHAVLTACLQGDRGKLAPTVPCCHLPVGLSDSAQVPLPLRSPPPLSP